MNKLKAKLDSFFKSIIEESNNRKSSKNKRVIKSIREKI